MSLTKRLIVFIIVAVYVKGNLYSDFVADFVNFHENNAMITEFSCNPKETIDLSKKLFGNGHYFNTISIRSSVDVVDVPFPMPPNLRYFILNLDCTNAQALLRKLNTLKYFSSPIKWIILTQKMLDSPGVFLKTYIPELDILVDSHVNFAHIQSDQTISVEKIFKMRHNRQIEFENFGLWTNTSGFVKSDFFETSIFIRRKNMFGTLLNTCIVITNNNTINHLTDRRDKHIDSITKVNYVLMNHLADIYNISLNFSIQNTWGYKNNKSEWSGMIGELTRNEADIGGTALFFTKDRVDIIDYIHMPTPTKSKFVFRAPKLSYVTNVYTLPFDNKVWICTLFLLLIGGFILYVVIKWEWRKKVFKRDEGDHGTVELKDSFSEIAIFTIGAMCQQGAYSLPFSLPGRISSVCLFLAFLFLYTSYAANIVALLQSSSTNIKSLSDLLVSRLKVGVDDTVFNRFYFPNADETVRKALYIQKVAPKGKPDNFMPIEEGIRKMREGLFAFHMETGPGYKVVSETFEESEKCGLQEIQFLQVIDPWLAIQKNSSYKEMLKIGLIQESGIQARETELIYTKKPVCSSTTSTFITVGIVDCYPAAALLAGGICIAVLIFIFEVYVNYRIDYYKIKWKKRFGNTSLSRNMTINRPSNVMSSQYWD